MKVCVVVAAYDERENVEPLTRRLRAALASIPGCRAEIVYVVEGTDGTREVLERLAREIPGLRVLYSEKPAGLGAAFRRGFAAVPRDADWVVTMDADLNHQPEEIPRLLGAASGRGLDILVGSRFVSGSRVEGIPLWKRVLSGTMNVLMRHLYGLSVLDKTSGFRIYRAAALRRLSFRNVDFAFLPELLIDAHRQGLRVGEEPIRFVYRVHGTSKMDVSTTIRSYLALLRSRFDRWSLLAAVLLALGLAVRLVSTVPVHAWGADMDSLLPGITAFRVLRGEWPAFFSYARIGALESWLHAASFSVFGVSRAATAVVPVLAAAGVLAAFLALCRSLVGRKAACPALAVVAVPSPAYMFWTYQPNGYPLTILLIVMTLLFADRLARRDGGIPTAFFLGFWSGLGWWCSLQTVAALIPSAAWILIFRRRVLRAPRLVAAIAFGVLLGAGPWLVHNVANDWDSLRTNRVIQTAGGRLALASNAAYLVRYSLPELLVAPDPEDGAIPPNTAQSVLRPVTVVAYGTAGLWMLALVIRWAAARRNFSFTRLPGWTLLGATALVMAALNVLSEAGAARGLTVRYVLPCYFFAAVSLALIGAEGERPTPTRLAVAAVLVVVAFNGAAVRLPGSLFRERRRLEAAGAAETLRFLETAGVRVAWGHFFWIYPLNFLSHETIRGIPYQRSTDLYHYTDDLPPKPVRWALVSRTPDELEGWSARAGLTGTITTFEAGYRVFLPEPNPPWSEPPARTHARILLAFDGSRRDP